MANLDLRVSTVIDAPAELVRRQFADVAHHEATGVHDGVRFEVLDDTPERCRYAQHSKVGPFTIRQELVLEHTTSGPLVNRVVAGRQTGATLSFDVEADGPDRSTVTATLSAPLGLAERPLAPLLRRSFARALTRALDEDRRDIETGAYAAAHPDEG